MRQRLGWPMTPEELESRFILFPHTSPPGAADTHARLGKHLGVEFSEGHDGELFAILLRPISALQAGTAYTVCEAAPFGGWSDVRRARQKEIARAIWECRFIVRPPAIHREKLGRIKRFFDPERLPL